MQMFGVGVGGSYSIGADQEVVERLRLVLAVHGVPQHVAHLHDRNLYISPNNNLPNLIKNRYTVFYIIGVYVLSLSSGSHIYLFSYVLIHVFICIYT